MRKHNLKSGLLFTAHLALVAVFAVIFFGLVITPANAATEWHIKDDATGGECSLIGNWNVESKTCILSQDLNQGIIIDSNNIVLDGSGHKITGVNAGLGIYVAGRTSVVIKNVAVENFVYGMLVAGSGNTVNNSTARNNYTAIYIQGAGNTVVNNAVSNDVQNIEDPARYGIHVQNPGDSGPSNVVTDNNVSRTKYGILLNPSSNSSVKNNFVSRNFFGVSARNSHNVIFDNNNALGNLYGVRLEFSSTNILTNNKVLSSSNEGVLLENSNNNTFVLNTISKNGWSAGLRLVSSWNNKIYNNNFDGNNFAQAHSNDLNIFYSPLPEGGNYWSNFDEPAEGCNNVNGDNFCDAPYIFNGGQDNLPWTKKDGWIVISNNPPILSFPSTGPYAGDGIDPNSGDTSTLFNFRVVYTDADDDTPEYVRLCIERPPDSLPPFPSCLPSVSPPDSIDFTKGWDGAFEGMSTSFPNPGTYKYHLESSDGKTTVRLPEQGELPLLIHSLPLPDLSIEKIKPIQVVENADINGDGIMDLVMSKPAIVRVRPKVTELNSFNQNQAVTIELSLGNDILSITKTLAELKTLIDDENGYIDFFVTPTKEGKTVLSVIIDKNNSIAEQDETNNQVVQELNIKRTSNLRLSYIPFTFPSFPNNFLVTSVMSSEFIDATYPVADVESDYSTSEYVSGLPARINNEKGVVFDLLSFWLWGKLLYPFSDQIFGVVSPDYFPYHNMGTTVGVHSAIGLNTVSLITEDYWTAATHEFGHAQGLWVVGPEEYELYEGGKDASGYWVKKQMEITNGQCFMGRAGQKESFYYNSTTPIWVDNEDYGLLFKERLEDKADPEVLLLSGWVEKDGTILINPFYRTNGNIDKISGSEYTIDLLDFNGNTINSFGFDVSFQLKSNPPVELDIAPFALTIPYHDNVQEIRISKEGKIVVEINSYTRLLHDAIASIPGTGFTKGNEQRRVALYNKVDALEKQLKNRDYAGAV
ncbi:right-handed parallel beta-helix repeat-containing protein, partial [Patescibacteria group bacterium]|nr:right-handed parallel beta-helix repeat-containing protein [Patescibacteria group bacterium]